MPNNGGIIMICNTQIISFLIHAGVLSIGSIIAIAVLVLICCVVLCTIFCTLIIRRHKKSRQEANSSDNSSQSLLKDPATLDNTAKNNTILASESLRSFT